MEKSHFEFADSKRKSAFDRFFSLFNYRKSRRKCAILIRADVLKKEKEIIGENRSFYYFLFGTHKFLSVWRHRRGKSSVKNLRENQFRRLFSVRALLHFYRTTFPRNNGRSAIGNIKHTFIRNTYTHLCTSIYVLFNTFASFWSDIFLLRRDQKKYPRHSRNYREFLSLWKSRSRKGMRVESHISTVSNTYSHMDFPSMYVSDFVTFFFIKRKSSFYTRHGSTMDVIAVVGMLAYYSKVW